MIFGFQLPLFVCTVLPSFLQDPGCTYVRRLSASKDELLRTLKNEVGSTSIELSLETKYPNWPSVQVKFDFPRSSDALELEFMRHESNLLDAVIKIEGVVAQFQARGYNPETGKTKDIRSFCTFSLSVMLQLAKNPQTQLVEVTGTSQTSQARFTQRPVLDVLGFDPFPKEYLDDFQAGLFDAAFLTLKEQAHSILNRKYAMGL